MENGHLEVLARIWALTSLSKIWKIYSSFLAERKFGND
jgi:hypothetical protein